jgi:hypothetical protein
MESPRGISARTRNPSPGRFGRNWTHGRGLRSKKIHPFNLAVQKLAGRGDYYCEHALTDTDELAEKVHDVVWDVTAQNDGLTEFLRKKVLQKRSGSHVPNDIVHFFGEFVGVRQRVLAVIIATAGEFLYREIERVDFF